jgi:Flp pilus assembly protein TadG
MTDLVHTARRHEQRGAIAIECMLVIGMIVVVFLIMLQYTVRAHAHRIATAAAEQGLAAASAYDGSAEDGRRTAQEYLHRLGPGLHGTAVSATRSATTAHVEITGEAEQLVPFLTVRVSAEVEGPTERFVEDPP